MVYREYLQYSTVHTIGRVVSVCVQKSLCCVAKLIAYSCTDSINKLSGLHSSHMNFSSVHMLNNYLSGVTSCSFFVIE